MPTLVVGMFPRHGKTRTVGGDSVAECVGIRVRSTTFGDGVASYSLKVKPSGCWCGQTRTLQCLTTALSQRERESRVARHTSYAASHAVRFRIRSHARFTSST